MSEEQAVEYLLPEWAQGFEQWLRNLTDGEAAFYVLAVTAIVGGIWRLFVWLRRKPDNQKPPIPSNPMTGSANQGIGNVQAEKIEIYQQFTEKPIADTSQEAPKPHAITIDKLPTVPGKFIGRAQELALLTNATQPDNKTRIVQLIAAGGTGKTKLLRHWLNQHEARFPNRIIWSFYSQGTTESKQVSLSPLLDEAFKAFKIDQTPYPTEEAKADAFIELVTTHQCLLVLDGLEPLQHIGRGMDGQLKDQNLLRILKKLLNQTQAQCLISSRLAVAELVDQFDDKVITHDLHNLSLDDAVGLLQAQGAQGQIKQLQAAAHEYQCHALAIHLLGNLIRIRYQGDIQQRDKIQALHSQPLKQTKSNAPSQHAYRVMQAYQEWFKDQAELSLLYLLGLFDQPIEIDILKTLQQAQIAQLTDQLTQDDFYQSLDNLKTHYQILSHHPQRPDLIDCHPLIREYFGQQLQQQHPSAYQAAHSLLYDYYKAIPKQEQPDTLDEMRPLFHAVAHGCAAGKHQQALDEVYWPRIKRENEHYLTQKLGAFSDDLAVVAHFFATPWRAPAAGLGPAEQAGVLNWAGFDLRALGRLREAMEPMRAATKIWVKQEDWKNAARNASNLSELQLTLGDLTDAVQSAAQSVDYADPSKDLLIRMYSRTTHADALQQTGQQDAALALFQTAEQIQQERQPEYPRLYSFPGFRYCDLLLAQGKTQEVLERAEYALKIVLNGSRNLLDIALNQLTLGRIYLQQDQIDLADEWLQQAVDGLRKAGTQDHLPRGLLSHAALLRHTGQFDKAQQDLHEVYAIANPNGMRLHMTDYHLESARLGFDRLNQQNDRTLSLSKGKALASTSSADEISCEITAHIQAADQLIRNTGYHRRDAELAQLQSRVE